MNLLNSRGLELKDHGSGGIEIEHGTSKETHNE